MSRSVRYALAKDALWYALLSLSFLVLYAFTVYFPPTSQAGGGALDVGTWRTVVLCGASFCAGLSVQTMLWFLHVSGLIVPGDWK